MKKTLIAVVVSIFFLTGCGTVSHVPMTNDNRETIKTVYINPQMKMPETMFEFRKSDIYSVSFLGLVGGQAAHGASQTAANSLKQTLDQHNIDIRKIVYQQWNKQLAIDHALKISNSPSDAVLTTEIVRYGVSVPHGFTSDYVPSLTLNATLTKNNKVLWQDSEILFPTAKNLPRYSMDQILSNPENVAIMWNKAAELLIVKMITDMKKSA